MQLHMEMVYKNTETAEPANQNNFSFEIDQTNQMYVPNNVAEPIWDLNFVRLPTKLDLYKEFQGKGGIKWEMDKKTIWILPTTAQNFSSPSRLMKSPVILT